MHLPARAGEPRRIAAALGLGTLAFGAVPVILPTQFARTFGFAQPDGTTASVFRSVGVRDVVLGMGLWSASAHNGNYAPWLLARLLTDGGDTIAITLAAGTRQAGARQPRFLALGAIALAATLCDAALYWLARQSATSSAATDTADTKSTAPNVATQQRTTRAERGRGRTPG